MRISGNQNMDVVNTSKAVVDNNNVPVKALGEQRSKTTENTSIVELTQQVKSLDNSEETKEKVQQAVHAMNDLLEANHNSSKFMYHEGLDRYYVTVVDKATEEVVKEIPPKKLLDAFYEMQKMVGMIVDEKI